MGAAHQGLAMVQVAHDRNVADKVGVAHKPLQKLVAVASLERLLLQHLHLLVPDGRDDGYLRASTRF